MPKDLDIVILRPFGPDSTAEMTRQFRKRFRVRRRTVEIWLEFLANNHPGYREFRLNRTTLNQLPEDGDVLEQLTIHTVKHLDGIPADSGPVDENLAAVEEGQDLDEAADTSRLRACPIARKI